MIDLKNKKVLITGATGGIGGSLVKNFLSLMQKFWEQVLNQISLKNLKMNLIKLKVKKFDISAILKLRNL